MKRVIAKSRPRTPTLEGPQSRFQMPKRKLAALIYELYKKRGGQHVRIKTERWVEFVSSKHHLKLPLAPNVMAYVPRNPTDKEVLIVDESEHRFLGLPNSGIAYSWTKFRILTLPEHP